MTGPGTSSRGTCEPQAPVPPSQVQVLIIIWPSPQALRLEQFGSRAGPGRSGRSQRRRPRGRRPRLECSGPDRPVASGWQCTRPLTDSKSEEMGGSCCWKDGCTCFYSCQLGEGQAFFEVRYRSPAERGVAGVGRTTSELNIRTARPFRGEVQAVDRTWRLRAPCCCCRCCRRRETLCHVTKGYVRKFQNRMS